MGAVNSVGSLLSGLSVINQGIGLVSNLSSSNDQRREQDLALSQLQAKQQLNAQQLALDNALERERLAASTQADEENRRRALRSAVARQKAIFGGSGVGNSGSGSQQAVLLGMFDETEEDLAQRERLDNLRNRALDLSSSQQQSVNVLQREQLKQRQNVSRVSSSLGRASDLVNFGSGVLKLF